MKPPVTSPSDQPTLEELEEKEAAAHARREQELERFGADDDDEDRDEDEQDDEDDEERNARRGPPAEPPKPILFADVVSGQFDADEESPDVALPKRVLTPQADTP